MIGISLAAAGAWLLAAQPVVRRQVARGDVALGPESPATPMDASRQPANNSPQLRADPTDGRFVALANRVDAPDYVCSLQLSGDGGRRWSPANPVAVLPPGADKCFGGDVAFDRQGRLYFLFLGLSGGGNEPMGAFLTTSADRGRTFDRPHQVLGALNFAVRMAMDETHGDGGRIHLVWVHATTDPPAGGFSPVPNPILSAYSDDGGATFSTPVQVSDPSRARVLAPAIAVGGDHRVHVAYYDLLDDARDYQALEGPLWDGKWSLVVATSADGGKTFQAGVEAEQEVTPYARLMAAYIAPPPALAAGGKRVCVSWTDARSGDPDILARCSDDGGRRWGTARRLNDDRVGTGAWQYLPALAIAPGGRVDAIFYDRRGDVQNVNNDVLYTFSRDGGRTYAPNTVLNRDGGSLSVVGQQYAVASAEGQWDFGSRVALLSRAHDAVAAWTDTRNSGPFTTAQDIFTTTIEPRPGRDALVLVAGAVLLLSGLGSVWAARRRWREARP